MKIKLTPVEDSDNYFLFHLFDDDRSDNYRDMYFSASIEEAEEIANQLLQLVFDATQPQAKHLSDNENIFNAMKTKSLELIGSKTPSYWFLKDVIFDEQRTFELYLTYNGEHFSHAANKKACQTLIDVYRRHHGLFIEKIYMLNPSGKVLSQEYFRH